MLPSSLKKDDDGTADAGAPFSSTEVEAISCSRQSSLREGAAQLASENRDSGGDGGNASPASSSSSSSSPTAVGPESLGHATLWAGLPRGVRSAVIEAVDVPELQVGGKLLIALPRKR